MTSFVLLPGSIAINFFFSIFIQFVWSLLNDLSFLTILALISVNIPGLASVIQSIILNYIYMDVLMTDKWLTKYLVEDDLNDCAINYYFDISGFQSKKLVKNLGSTFVYLALLVLGLVILAILKVVAILFRFAL
jgi:hypothetical protein